MSFYKFGMEHACASITINSVCNIIVLVWRAVSKYIFIFCRTACRCQTGTILVDQCCMVYTKANIANIWKFFFQWDDWSMSKSEKKSFSSLSLSLDQTHLQSISSTFYARVFRTKVVLRFCQSQYITRQNMPKRLSYEKRRT